MRALLPTLVAVAALGCCHQTSEARPPEVPAQDKPEKTSPKPTGLGGLLLPPSTPGESQTRLEGCLAQKEAGEEAGSRFPAKSGSRSAPTGPAAQVSTVAGGVLITHELSHACCLTAAVTSSVEGQKLTVRETLSGSPCRCLCQSTVRTAVGLSPGHYTLTLVQDGQGPAVTVLEQPLDIR